MKKNNKKLSPLQQKAKNEILKLLSDSSGKKYASLEAAPGSGKTTTIVSILETYFNENLLEKDLTIKKDDNTTVTYLKGNGIIESNYNDDTLNNNINFVNQQKKALILSFNKKITEDIYKNVSNTYVKTFFNNRLTNNFLGSFTDVSTYHSIFYNSVKELFLDKEDKTKYLYLIDHEKSDYYKNDLKITIDKCRLNIDTSEIDFYYSLVNNFHKSKYSLIDFIKKSYAKDNDLEGLKEIAKNASTLIKSLYQIQKRKEIKMPVSFYYKLAYEKAQKDNGFLKKMFSDKSGKEYDFVIIDEAQDSDEMIYELIKKSGLKMIPVGDRMQNIFSFKGTYDIFTALKREYKEETIFFSLNESFRFGKAISHVVKNSALLKDKTNNVSINGVSEKDAVFPKPVNIKNIENLIGWSKNKKNKEKSSIAIITRTNQEAFDIYLELKKNKYIENEVKIESSIRANLNKFLKKGFDFIKDTSLKENIKNELDGEFDADKFFKNEKIKKMIFNSEYKYLLKVEDKNLRNAISKRQSGKETVTITTSHQSKGLEYETVIIARDFIQEKNNFTYEHDISEEESIINEDFIDSSLSSFFGNENITPGTNIKPVKPEKENSLTNEEINIIYTVCSRAKSKLIFMNSPLFGMLKEQIEYSAYNLSDDNLLLELADLEIEPVVKHEKTIDKNEININQINNTEEKKDKKEITTESLFKKENAEEDEEINLFSFNN